MKSPFSSPAVNLLLCALCVYAGILSAMVWMTATARISYFFASAFSLLAAFRFFQNYLKLKKRKQAPGP